MILKLVRTPGIYLVGFMGSGKTTVGRLLAERLGWDFIDLDEEVESDQKTSITEIFECHGEEYFRALETEAIRRHVTMVRGGRPLVIALGGGAFAHQENYELLQDHGVTIWLDCPLDVARSRVQDCSTRPLARDARKFAELYQRRQPAYSRADYRVATVDEPAHATVDAIRKLPIF